MINTVIADLGTDESAAFTRKNIDGTYTIVLNGRYSAERLREAYEHELKHIEREDLEDVVNIQETELAVRDRAEPTIFGIPASEYLARQKIEWAKNRRRLIAKMNKRRRR